MDLQSRTRWVEYSIAKDEMFRHTDIKQAPWYVVAGDDKRRARLNVIHHLLSLIPYEDLTPEPIVAAAARAGPRLRPPADGRADVRPRGVLSVRQGPLSQPMSRRVAARASRRLGSAQSVGRRAMRRPSASSANQRASSGSSSSSRTRRTDSA